MKCMKGLSSLSLLYEIWRYLIQGIRIITLFAQCIQVWPRWKENNQDLRNQRYLTISKTNAS